jgi:macrolide transport system ATP-binding/permease protein
MWRWLEEMLRDARLAIRALWRSPVFAITAVASLALGIGANVASFSAADAFLLRPLPVQQPDRLMAVFTRTPDRSFDSLSYLEWEELQQNRDMFQGAAGYSLRQFAFAPDAASTPQMRMGMMVAPGFFEVLGVTPALGRSFTTDETRRGGGVPAVVLGHDFWVQQYGADRSVVGRTLRVNGVEAHIAGIAPESFTGMDPFIRPAFFVPVVLAAPAILEDRGVRSLQVRARLAPGVSPVRAEASLQAFGAALERTHPDTNRARTFIVRSDLQQRLEQTPQLAVLVILLLVLSALVLAISCANVAGLLLGRSRARFRELAIRVAVGAGRGRLMRQFLTESLVLAGSGGVAGVAMAQALSLFLASIRVPTDTPIVIATRIDWRALVFTLAVSVVSALAFGLLPGLRLSRMTLVDSLRASSGGGVGSTGRNWSRRVLVSAQVALSLVLLVVSASMIDAFHRMSIADPGMRTRGLYLFEFNPAMVGYSEARSIEFYRQLKDRVRELPGVHSAALSRAVPFRPNFTERDIVPEGYEMPAGRTAEWISTNLVDEHYLATAGVPLIHGRGFAETDTARAPLVAVVNEEFANRYWSSPALAVGRRIKLGVGEWVQVVGVARTAKYLSMAETPQPYVYLPFAQHPSARMTMMVAGEGQSVAESILRTVRDMDANMPVFNVRSMDTFYAQGVLGPALLAVQMVVAAGITGLALALIGIYGLVSYSAERRTREIGIRMAIGASRWSVLRMMLGEGLTLASAGTLVGLVISVPAFRAMSAKLAGLGGLSPWALWVAPVLLIAVAACACFFPSRRAAAIDPIAALRVD